MVFRFVVDRHGVISIPKLMVNSGIGKLKNGIGIDGIGIDKFEVELELTKWNWLDFEMTK